MPCAWRISPPGAAPVAGKAFAGQPYEGEWPAGHCIRIMTGAPVPRVRTLW